MEKHSDAQVGIDSLLSTLAKISDDVRQIKVDVAHIKKLSTKRSHTGAPLTADGDKPDGSDGAGQLVGRRTTSTAASSSSVGVVGGEGDETHEEDEPESDGGRGGKARVCMYIFMRIWSVNRFVNSCNLQDNTKGRPNILWVAYANMH